MQFPETSLRNYLRTFRDPAEVERLLDVVAQTALDIEVRDPIELYVLAHAELRHDPRLTPELEAVVLVEEAGLTVADAAIVTELSRQRVEDAVRSAWLSAHPRGRAESDGVSATERTLVVTVDESVSTPTVVVELPEAEPRPEPAEPLELAEPAGPAEPIVVTAPDVDAERTDAQQDDPSPPAPEGILERIMASWSLLTAVGAGAGVLGALALSDVGSERLAERNVDPGLLVLVMIGLLAGGIMLVLTNTPPEETDQSEPPPGENGPAN